MVEDNDKDDDAMVRDQMLLSRRVNLQKVTLPDSRIFYATYQRVGRKNLLANVTIKRTRANRPQQQQKRKKQKGAELLGSAFNLGSRLFNSTFGKKLIEERIEHTLDIYNAGVKKVQNKKLKRALE